MTTFFTADLHLGHTNIIKYCNRPFDDIAHHDQALIDNWNQVVTNNDKVYVIGDLCMGNPWEWVNYVNKLNGRIYLIPGNHDMVSYYKNMDTRKIQVLADTWIYWDADHGFDFLLNHYPIGYPKNPGTLGYNIALSGHVHQHWKMKINNWKPNVNVGVDVWNYYPVTIPEILKVI